jgi:ribosomal protein S18 acetylase RimI-like enzyme
MRALRYAPRMPKKSGVRVHRAQSGDEGEVARFEEAFDFDVLADETERFLTDERHYLLLGYFQERPAGFVSAVEVFHPDKRGELFLNEIAVMEGARRRGVARALIEELKRIGRERGCVSMWVLTDEGNPTAMRLYGSSGGRTKSVPQVMFEYDLVTP